MTSRGRASHVQPRPPSTGRPRKGVRAAAPSTQRVRAHRGLEARRRRLPLPARALLTLSVMILGAAVFLTASGGIGPVVASLGNSFADAFNKLVATPNPSPTLAVATDAPIIAAPTQPYTNQPQATLHITVPVAVVGTTATVRVYVALQGLSLTPVGEVAVGSTTQVQAQVDLTKGRNDFSATVVKDGVESPQAPVVTIVLDQDPPKVTISSPANGASISASTVTIVGTTQAGSDLLARNGANGVTTTGTADANGKFSLTLTIEQGSNAITIQATDPAGNETTLTLTVKQGSGTIQANLSASTYQIRTSSPPSSIQLRVLVTDPTGAPLPGATATFTLTIHGCQPITNVQTTDASGRATFTTPLTCTYTVGTGLATVLVSYTGFGNTTDRVPMNVVK
ncbi:MAG TPA: Ig-like domain-containing protein [Candidatus Limnocylindrales bacterium]|nr:Ig-like domain-containing protein [Candidatus Limnocylindrales bacterium]